MVGGEGRGSVRWTNSSTCNYEIVICAHALHCFHDLIFVVGNDFNSFEGLTVSALYVQFISRQHTIPNWKQNFAMYALFVYHISARCIFGSRDPLAYIYRLRIK